MRIKGWTRRITLLFIGLVSCILLMAQQNQINDIVQINFPLRTVRLTTEEVTSFLRVADKDSTLALPIDSKRQYYNIDSCLVKFHGERSKAPENYLEEIQKKLEAISTVDGMRSDRDYQIRKVNNYSVLISNIDSQYWGSYFFFSVNRDNSAILNGSLHYFKSSSDKAKALKTLEELLKSISYKF